jgi:hypothetical protein
MLCLSLRWAYWMEKLSPDHHWHLNNSRRLLCTQRLNWWSYAYETGVDYNWVLRIKPTQSLKTTRVPLIWLATLCTTSTPNISGMTSFVTKWLMERTSFWRFHPDPILPISIPRPMQNKCSTWCHRIITEIDTVWCSYGAYLLYDAQLKPMLYLW